jgi:HK97 family phage major capsid protein
MDFDINDARRQRVKLATDAQAILAKQGVTNEEIASATAMLDEADGLKAKIEAFERATGVLDSRSPLEPPANPKDPNAFVRFGEQLRAVANAAIGRGVDPRLLHATKAAATGLNETVPSDGGFLVGTDYAAELYKLAHEGSQLASRCRSIPISNAANRMVMKAINETSRVDGSRWGGVQSYWAAEADSVSSSKITFREIEWNLHKLMATCYCTEEELQDAATIENKIREAFNEEMAFKLDNSILRGTGSGQPLGILNSAAYASVAKENGQAADTITAGNVIDMRSRIFSRSRQDAVWAYNDECDPQLMKMNIAVGTGGIPVWMPAGGLSTQPYDTLFGKPLIPVEQASALGDLGDIMFLDLGGYGLAEKGGVQTAVSIHVAFLTAESVFRFIMRVDGKPFLASPVTPYMGAATHTKSHFVALAAR